ncbi:MAG: glycosyltransferase family 4 protein [Candidatus Riflebacteria bacterium]|nr:glycosyltransferase family 4 protein [Candidatus Riflebacteria bacterium]
MRSWLLVCLDFPPEVGGIQTYLGEIARRMDRLAVVAPAASGAPAYDATFPHPVDRIPLPRQRGLSGVPWLALETVRQLPWGRFSGVIWGHPKLAVAAGLVSGLGGLPSVVCAYGMDVTTGSLRPLMRWGLSRAWRLVTISSFTRARLEALGVSADRIRIVSPGVEAPDPDGPRAAVSGADDRPVVLTVGRIEAAEGYKGHDRVVEAMPLVLARCPGVRWVVVGDGSGLPALRELVRERGLGAWIELRGRVGPGELADLYRRCDLFLMPSRVIKDRSGERFEGFGIVYLEAARVGKPVVAGRVGGAVDAVLDGETGILVDPDDPRDIAAAVISLLEDPARRQAMGERGRSRVARSFTWDRAAAALTGVLEELS